MSAHWPVNERNRDIASTENLVHADLLKHEQPELSLPCLDQRFGFGCEPRFSRDMSQFGKICSMEYAAKAGLCRRLSRRVNMIASKHPVKAPRNASVIERLLKVRSPWPVRRNPVYAIATVQRITRTGCTGITSTAEPGKRADMRSGLRSGRKQLRNRSPSRRSSRECECLYHRFPCAISYLPRRHLGRGQSESKDTLDSMAAQHQRSMSNIAIYRQLRQS
jgi:hypothetical protein